MFTGGQLRPHPPSADTADPASQRWYWRQADRHAQIAQVHELAAQGLSQRAIALRTGHNRRTVKLWLAQPVPPLPPEMPKTLSGIAALPAPQQRRERKVQLRQQVHTLAQEGFTYSAIARQTGLHRLTVKSWLAQAPEGPDGEPVSPAPQASETQPPPDGWADWQQVRQLRADLKDSAFSSCAGQTVWIQRSSSKLQVSWLARLAPNLRSFAISWLTGMPSGMIKTGKDAAWQRRRCYSKPGSGTLPARRFRPCTAFKNWQLPNGS